MAEIRIEVVYEANGGEELGLYAEGHHVPADFVAAVEAWRLTPEGAWLPSELVPTVLLSEVRHETWRNEDDGDGYVFRPASPGEPGAYPVTCFAFEGGTLAAPPAPAPSPPETPARDADRCDCDGQKGQGCTICASPASAPSPENPRRLYRYCPGTDHPMAPSYCATTPHDECEGCDEPLLAAGPATKEQS